MKLLLCLALVNCVSGYFLAGEMSKDLLASWNATFTYGEDGEVFYRVRIPICGSTKSNCWEQTAGASTVNVATQDTSGAFPCRTGTNFNTFTGTNHVAIAASHPNHPCTITVSGLGASNGNAGLCKPHKGSFGTFGYNCPAATGSFTATGDAASCSAGVGSYTATMACSQSGSVIFRIVTYFTY
jgi:hypothetical protein